MRAFAEPLRVEDVADPEPAPDGVVVSVRATGVCRSDWHGWMGHDPAIELPHVPGHELAGEVVAVGAEVRGFAVGDRVTVPFCCGCGTCEPCRHGQTQICDRDFQPGFTAWGSFAELVALPRADLNLVRLPEELDFVAAASLGCRFMTAFAAVTEHGRVGAGDWVAVHGCGGVGLSAVMAAKVAGVGTIIAVDPVADRRQIATEIGATATVDPASDDVVDAIRQLTGAGATHALDTTAIGAVINQAIAALAALGTLALVGVGTPEIAIDVQSVIGGGKTIRGVIEGDAVAQQFVPQLLDLYAEGRLPLEKLIRTYDFDDIDTAVADAGSGATIKPVLVL